MLAVSISIFTLGTFVVRSVLGILSRYISELRLFTTQCMVKQWEASSLRDHGVVSNSGIARLPPEIWTDILAHILDPHCSPYQYCTASTFPVYQARHLHVDIMDDQEEKLIKADCRNIRQVCREWAAIAGAFGVTTFSKQQSTKEQGARNMTLEQGGQEMHVLSGIPSIASRLKVLIIGRAQCVPSSDYVESISILLDSSSKFPQLRSLSILSDVPSNFWTRLQRAYPLLNSLTLASRVPQVGALTLNQLEILDILWTDGTAFRLPSLKHCCIRCDRDTLRSLDLIAFLSSHGRGLDSLLLPRVTHQEVGASEGRSLWSLCPNLKALGLCAWNFSRYQRLGEDEGEFPPDGHPLEHLCIGPDRWPFTDSFEDLRNALKRMNIKQLSMRRVGLMEREMRLLKELCQAERLRLSWVPVSRIQFKIELQSIVATGSISISTGGSSSPGS